MLDGNMYFLKDSLFLYVNKYLISLYLVCFRTFTVNRNIKTFQLSLGNTQPALGL